MVEIIKRLRKPGSVEQQLRRNVGRMNSAVLQGLASTAVGFSPVDTGTYVTSHTIFDGDSVASVPALNSSIGRIGGQDAGVYRGRALAELNAQIESLTHADGQYVFGNEAEHRADVENDHGYKVFRNTARSFPSAVAAAKAVTGLK